MTTWQLDPAHTQVTFSAKHMMVTTVRGRFPDVEGTIVLDEEDPTRSHGSFQVAAGTIDTNFAARDTHLRSADFFHAERFPTISFASTSVEPAGGDKYRVTGDLTIRDVTKPVTFDVELDGIVPGMRGGRHVGLSATTKIQRDDWGLNWNVALEQGGWLVGKEIKLDITVAADEVQAEVPAETVGASA
jgi:polyisoprenoid-binding protein YceI